MRALARRRRHPPVAPPTLTSGTRVTAFPLALAVPLFLSCASSGNALASGSGPGTVVVNTGAGDAHIVVEGNVIEEPVAAPSERVLRALAVVYPQLGLEPDWIDPDEKIVGLTEIELRRTLKDAPLSRYVSCGRTVTSAEVADESRVRLGVVTQVLEGDQPGTSVMATRLEAAAFHWTAVSDSGGIV